MSIHGSGTTTGMAVAVAAAAMLFSTYALATPTIELAAGESTSTIKDGDSADVNGEDGSITLEQAIGDYDLEGTIGTTKPAVGSAAMPNIDLTAQAINNTATDQDLTIKFSETDFVGNGSPMDFTTAVGGTTMGDDLDVTTYLNASNTLFGEGTMLSEFDDLNTQEDGRAFAANDTTTLSPDGNYALEQIVEISHDDAGDVSSFNTQTTEVPIPATLLLFGAGLFGLGLFGRRRS